MTEKIRYSSSMKWLNREKPVVKKRSPLVDGHYGTVREKENIRLDWLKTEEPKLLSKGSSKIKRASSFVFQSHNSERKYQPAEYEKHETPINNESDYLQTVPYITTFEKEIPQLSPKEKAGFKASIRKPIITVTPFMGRAMRVVVAGGKKTGKTAILRQVACMEDITSQEYRPTIADTFQVLLEEADKPREILVFHDTAGLTDHGGYEIPRPAVQVADAFVLVYNITDHESFNKIDLLKKWIDKQFGKEKKEVPIVVLGNMRDLPGRRVEYDFAMSWAARERVKLFEVSAKDRNSLVEFVTYLGQRHFHPTKDSKFSLSKKLKSEKSNAAIMMDF